MDLLESEPVSGSGSPIQISFIEHNLDYFLGRSFHRGVLAPEAELHAVPEADVDPVRLPDALLGDGHAIDVVLQGGLDVVRLQGHPVGGKTF